MIERYPEYQDHPLFGRTYDTISQYDGWMISKFLCDYITHYSDGQRWGMKFLSNSPENNHSKVIDSKIELEKKIDYLNKDKYFIKNTNDYLVHLVPEYSDYHLWTTHKKQSNTPNKMWYMSLLEEENDICMNGC